MTTIAYKAGVMAADSRAYSGNRDFAGAKAKIERLEDGTLVGSSSTIVGGGEQVRQWYKDGCDPQAKINEKFTLLIAKPNGELYIAESVALLAGPLNAEFMAIGTGSDIALGVMEAGGNAVRAVKAACKFDVWSEVPIYAASHSGDMPKILVDLPVGQFIWIE